MAQCSLYRYMVDSPTERRKTERWMTEHRMTERRKTQQQMTERRMTERRIGQRRKTKHRIWMPKELTSKNFTTSYYDIIDEFWSWIILSWGHFLEVQLSPSWIVWSSVQLGYNWTSNDSTQNDWTLKVTQLRIRLSISNPNFKLWKTLK